VKRGPTGIINTNIIDARETVAAITEDCATGRVTPAAKRDEDVLQTMVQAGKHDVVSWEAYQRIDEWEQKQGTAKGKPREKIILTDEMLKIARG
jgi:NADPH-dependent glutamate synthase beta subunit-like oxidoreductase